jgi:hypothetical protein
MCVYTYIQYVYTYINTYIHTYVYTHMHIYIQGGTTQVQASPIQIRTHATRPRLQTQTPTDIFSKRSTNDQTQTSTGTFSKRSASTYLCKNRSLEMGASEESHTSEFQQHDGGFASMSLENGVLVTGVCMCVGMYVCMMGALRLCLLKMAFWSQVCVCVWVCMYA